MSRHANAARFGEGAQGGTWYSPPYPRVVVEQPWRARAAWLQAQYPAANIGIAGCGTALTLYWLFTDFQHQSRGFDVEWIAAQGRTAVGAAYANNVITADVLSSTDMQAFRRAGNTGQRKYDLIFTEDLLPAMDSEAEVATALARLREIGTTLVHLVTPLDPSATQTPDMLWLSPSQWRQRVSSDRLILPGMVEVP